MQTKELDKYYWEGKNRILAVNIGLTFFFLVLMIGSFSLPLRNIVDIITANAVMVISLYLVLAYVFYFMFTFGLKYYEEFIFKNKFALAVNPFNEWIKQLIEKEVNFFFGLLGVVQVIYFFLETYPKQWWVWVAVFWISVEIGTRIIIPEFILPLWYKYLPFKDENVKIQLIRLADKIDVKITDIFIIKNAVKKFEKGIDARLIGWGAVRKLILNEAILTYSEEEIKIIVAHELAHLHYAHKWKCLLLYSLEIFFGFFIINILFRYFAQVLGFKPISDIASLPLLMFLFLIIMLIITPLKNGYSRITNKEADRFSLVITKSPAAFVSVMIRYLEQNLEDPNPSHLIEKMFYDCPSIAKRILTGQDYARDLASEKSA